jgi:hypothetical protein
MVTIRVMKSGSPVKNAKVQIKWFSQFGGIQVGEDSAYTNSEGQVEFNQGFNLFGAHGEGTVTTTIGRADFEVKLDAYGNAPMTVVHMQTNIKGVAEQGIGNILAKSWPLLIVAAVIIIASGFFLTALRPYTAPITNTLGRIGK